MFQITRVLRALIFSFFTITLGLAQSLVPQVYFNNSLVPATTSESIFGATIPDAPLTPIQIDGHWLIPVRFLHFVLGKDIWWDAQWGLLEVDRHLHFRLNNLEVHFPMAAIGGAATSIQPLEVAPQIINDRLYVPLEITLELLRYEYRWGLGEKVLYIQSP
jgi:Copper amine oxidase N-terminal domain